MLVTYPALFYYDNTDGANAPYFITFPDFEYSATQSEDIEDAITMTSDWLGIHLRMGEIFPCHQALTPYP